MLVTPWLASPTQTEPLDQGRVAADVALLEVVEEPAPATDEQQQATTTVMVMLVRAQVLGEVGDAAGQDRNLYLGGPGVALGGRVVLHDLCLQLCCGRPDLPVRFFGVRSEERR